MSSPSLRLPLATVALVGLASLMYELVQVRMLSFFLGNSMDFLAIPIALLGLTLGSVWTHFLYRGEPQALLRRLRLAAMPVTAAVFLAVFFVANHFFDSIHFGLADPRIDGLRLVVYSAIFLPGYAVFGAMLATLFGLHAERIGRMYFYDLAGAALGCMLAPMLLTWVDLWAAIVGVLTATFGLWALEARARKGLLLGGAGALLLLGGLAGGGVIFAEHPQPDTLARSVRGSPEAKVTERYVRWNQIARTAYVTIDLPDEGGRNYYVIQDNGLSNVRLYPFREDRDPAPILANDLVHTVPWRLDREPQDILVVFAGAGRDMMLFHALSGGTADITGVELNPLVVSMGYRQRLAKLNIPAFHALDNVDLRVDEGRDFLNTDEGLYDYIHVANNGAVHASRTGHTRKFLDTREAMEAYLDHLAEGGIIVFQYQPVESKLRAFEGLLAERGGPPLSECVFVFGKPNIASADTLVVKPSGFTDEELRTLRRAALRLTDGTHPLYPGNAPAFDRISRIVEDTSRVREVTDDRPFLKPLSLPEWQAWPEEKLLKDRSYVSTWVKIWAVILFTGASLLVAGAARLIGGQDARVPGAWVLYLLFSGVGYMGVQVGLIAKTELFIGNPLYAISINLAAVLIANSVGALLQDRLRLMKGPLHLLGFILLAALWAVGCVEFFNEELLSVALPLKALGVVIATFPVGVAMGCFYPYSVQQVVQGGHARSVPMTYALTTLSSVLGSVFAMTAIIDLGFNRVIAVGVAAYLLAAGMAWFGRARGG